MVKYFRRSLTVMDRVAVGCISSDCRVVVGDEREKSKGQKRWCYKVVYEG